MYLSMRNKQDILNDIIVCEIGIQLEKDVMEVVQAFKHRKNVDKSFTDAVELKGYHAYIVRDKFSRSLTVRKPIDHKGYISNQKGYVEFRVYRSECMEKRPFRWEEFAEEFQRYNYKSKLEDLKGMLEVFDNEVKELKKLEEQVKSINFKCFDLWKLKSDLAEALNYASR